MMMRHAVVAFFLIAALSPVAATRAVAAEAPASQASAKAREQRSIAFFERIMLGDYARVGRTSPKWDGATREALGAMVRLWAVEFTPTNDEHDVIWHAVKAARKAGCDDPLLRLAQARNYAAFDRRYADTAALHVEAATMLAASDYHPLLKCYALLRAADWTARAEQDPDGAKARAAAMLDDAMAHIAAIAADAEVPRLASFELFRAIGEASQRATGSREPYCAKAFAVFDQRCADRSTVLTLAADFYSFFAWEGGPEPGVALQATLDEWLGKAQLAAEEAWRIDPTNDLAARVMMKIEANRNDGAERHDAWFRRAMEASPSNAACWEQLRYLSRRAGRETAVDAMLRHGRECFATGNFEAGLPLTLVEAHVIASRLDKEGNRGVAQHAYFRDEQVWKDVKGVYDEYLRRVPTSLFHRGKYATMACWAGDWAEADRQFRAMGKRFSYAYFRNESRYRAQVAEVRKHVPAEPATSPAG